MNNNYSLPEKLNFFLGEAKDFKNFLDNVLKTVIEIIKAEAGLILTEDEYNNVKVQVFSANVPLKKETDLKDEIEKTKIPLKESGLGEISNMEKKLKKTDNPDLSISYRKIVKEVLDNVANIVSVPIRAKSSLIGVIELYNVKDNYSDDIRKTLMYIGSQIGTYAGMFKREKDLKERLQALRQLAKINEAIKAPHQIDMTVDLILKNAKRFFEAYGSSLLVKDDEDNMIFVSVVGEHAPAIKGKEYTY